MHSEDNPGREKWNRIYAEDSGTGEPAAVLRENADLLPSQGRALDIACGSGANSFFMAERGLSVDAWDISDVAVSQINERATSAGLRVHASAVDISPASLPAGQYDVVVNCHYLDRLLYPAIEASLRPGGLLFFQTFVQGKPPGFGPSRSEFLLEPGELMRRFAHLEILAYREAVAASRESDALAGRCYIVARAAGR